MRKAGGRSSDWRGRRRLMREGQWLWLRGAGRGEGAAIGGLWLRKARGDSDGLGRRLMREGYCAEGFGCARVGEGGGSSDLSWRRGSVMSGRPALVARAAAAAAVAAARAAAAAALAAVAGSA